MSFFYKERTDNYRTEEAKVANIAFVGGGVFVIVVICWMAFGPMYNVWQQGLAGQAELRRAEQNRQIKVQEAQALKDSATLIAESEVLRARGVKEANEIIAQSLDGQDEYLRYLYIDMLRDTAEKQIIYIPTEASLPILEASKR